MSVKTKSFEFSLSTKGDADVHDITDAVAAYVKKSGLREGCVVVSAVGSTACVTTCEYEPGLVQDIKEILDRLIPPGRYHHDAAWGDGNGHAHLRASLIGPSLSLVLRNGALVLGTWQQIIFIDMDNRPRRRCVVVSVIGEP